MVNRNFAGAVVKMNGRILIFESLVTNRIILKVRLGVVGYLVDIASSCDEVLAHLTENLPDAVIIGHGLQGAGLVDFLRQLRALPGAEAVPVMVLGPKLPGAEVARILRAGADCVLARPVQDPDLHARLRRLIGADDALRRLAPTPDRLRALGLAEQPATFLGPGRIALVTERPQDALTLRHQLSHFSQHNFLPLLPEEALAGRGDKIDVYVIDAKLGASGNGLRMLAELSGRANSQRARFVIWRLADDMVPEYSYFDGGADEVLNPSLSAPEIAALLDRLLARKGQFDRLHNLLRDGLRLATVDPLTEIDNRRSGMARLGDMLRHASGGDTASVDRGLAVVVIDIDKFKSVNDRFGHPVGDQVLIEVARRLRLALRPQDILCRLGGEEFMAVLGDVTEAEARLIAQRLCDHVERHAMPVSNQRAIRVTISAGMALIGGQIPDADPMRTADRLIDEADRALMHSKAAGRNQLTVANRAA